MIIKVRRTIFLYDATVHGCASHSSFLNWIKVVLRGGRRLAHLLAAGSCRTAPATWSTPHAALGSVLHASESPDASSGLPGPPAGGRGKDGRIHNDKRRHSTQRLSEKWCHDACISAVIIVCISPSFCAGVQWIGRRNGQTRTPLNAGGFVPCGGRQMQRAIRE